MKASFSSVVIASVLFMTNLAFGQGLAFVSKTIAVGNGPYSVIAADLNNDGTLGLVCTDSKDNALTILTNDGSGGFVSNITYSVPLSYPDFVTATDINGDGKLDLICAGTGQIFVLTNDGSGGFVSNAVYHVAPGGPGPTCVVATNINGGGKPDLITANYGEPTLTVLTNDGSGSFMLSSNLTVGSRPAWVAAADINGDGRVDLVTANVAIPGSSSVTVFTNNDAGDFGSNATYSDFFNPYCIATADIRNDGRMDLITANQKGGLAVLTNNGSGSFGASTNYTVDPSGSGAFPIFVTAADINGDGKADLVCANAGTDTLTVLTNDGSGGFDLCTNLTVGNCPQSIALTDMNGDGKLDLICANYCDNTLTVLAQIVPPPELAIAPIGQDAVSVSWPSSPTNFVLQTNTDLTTANWGISGYPVSTNGSTKSITINTLPLGNLFFRLISQ